MTNRRPDRNPEAGLTLLELLVTAGILATLMGLGVGFLRRSDGLPEARSAIVGMLRMAALDARTRGLPTEVLLSPGEDGSPAEVRARALDPQFVLTMESAQRQLDSRFTPTLGGEDVSTGRIGHARRPREGDQSPAARVQLSPEVVDLSEGFALRFDVRLTNRGSGALLRIGTAVTLRLDDAGRPEARIATVGEDGRVGATITLESRQPLPAGRWCSLEIAADGSRSWIAIDGRIVAENPQQGRLRQQRGDQLELAPGGEAFGCEVDELQLFAYAFAEPQRLPEGALLLKPVRIAFDDQGEPISPPSIELKMSSDGRIEKLDVGPGGVLQ
jgi:hypothetical protein